MALAQPCVATFAEKQAIVLLAPFVPLHSSSMLVGAQVDPNPENRYTGNVRVS